MRSRWIEAYHAVILGTIEANPRQPAGPQTMAAREAVEAAGARMLFLPPYSPDVNPIENAFSKLKAILRKAAARTVPELWDAIRVALACFTPQECANYSSPTGYEPE